MNSDQCKICMFDFKPGTLVDGRCTECAKKFPDAENMKEVKERQNPEAKKSEAAFEAKLEKIINRKLKEIGILTDCECGKSFFKKSPSHKRCGACPKSEDID